MAKKRKCRKRSTLRGFTFKRTVGVQRSANDRQPYVDTTRHAEINFDRIDLHLLKKRLAEAELHASTGNCKKYDSVMQKVRSIRNQIKRKSDLQTVDRMIYDVSKCLRKR